jgi:hypothetical protein
MPAAKHLTLDTVDFNNRGQVNAFLEQVTDEGMRRVRAEGAELRASGLMDAEGKLLVAELPPDVRRFSPR